MAPGSKKSSASSNSTGSKRNTSPVRVDTTAPTPSEVRTLTPSMVASPSTRASASGAPLEKAAACARANTWKKN
ncbi:hypothetical protein RHMOL_Rhmol05G0292900 [Rhododendron molle]|uniref:Uncharacterized protein n=1 Tax=Rhododendron molle TaxID=49168 RepID=A0ACC0NVW1_RHOML|nr:hypothetical protein RHMOL_Rhmol05G0292900 [Rhododendron molle]